MAANATDYARITALDEELRGLAIEQERLEEAWLAAAELVSDDLSAARTGPNA